jgi:hypothetical protein
MNAKVTFTPAGGSLTALDGIKGATYDEGMEELSESADVDVFPTVGGVVFSKPMITINSIDAMQISAVVGGTFGVLVVTFPDFKNGVAAGGGAKVVTLSNAYLMRRSASAQYRQLSTQDLGFSALSTDGATSPMAITTL